MEQSTPWFSDQDLHLFNEGNYLRAYEKLGAHETTRDGVKGTHFAVWAPSAAAVCVVGSFNEWARHRHPLTRVGASGLWAGFIPGIGQGTIYKYHIQSAVNSYRADKTDPYGVFCEVAPKTASIVWNLDYDWHDADYLAQRKERQCQSAPVSIYEVHFGSWTRAPGDPFRSLSYREMAEPLANHVKKLGFTHVEFMPLTEHPYYGSWGYQTTGYFAATSRYGTPQDLMYLIDYLHQQGIGVILDWVPSHFATDGHALAYFDGTHLYEHADPRQGYHQDWGSYIFNYGRHEVRSFLLSSAIFWLDKYHVDGLRVDAVASMLYLDYSRKPGQWVPNRYGGKENLEAIQFLRRFNEAVYEQFPDVQTYAEESTSWPMVSRPTYVGGLGFGYKWDMGWMHDTLRYCRIDPLFRKYNQNDLTFRMLYAHSENFVLPLSHDEVVHGKGPLFDKMVGDERMKLAGLRLLYAYQWGMTGKKLLFMGGEFGQRREWNHDTSLDWALMDRAPHAGLAQLVRDLNTLYRQEPAMHELDNQPGGFEWVDCADANASVVSFLRKPRPILLPTPPLETTVKASLPLMETAKPPLPAKATFKAPLPVMETVKTPLPAEDVREASLSVKATVQALSTAEAAREASPLEKAPMEAPSPPSLVAEKETTGDTGESAIPPPTLPVEPEPQFLEGDVILGVFNFTPVVRENYRIGVPYPGYWRELLNTDAACYGGTNVGNSGGVQAEMIPYHNRPYSIVLTLPPMGALFFKGTA